MQKATFRIGATYAMPQYLTKTLLIVKLTIFLLTAAFVNVYASGLSQTVTYSGENVSIKTILQVVEKQTGYVVFGDEALLEKANKVTINADREELTSFLSKVFKGQGLEYKITNRNIVIKALSQGADLKSTPSIFPSLPPITVRGRIVNENGEPVIASIIIKDTKRGTTSNDNGYFQLENVSDDAILIISASNIETITISVNGKSSLNINVKMTSLSLNEVVVNKGYYKEKQRLSTGSVVKVSAKDIERQPVVSPLLSLQGQLAGVDVSPVNGASSIAPRIRIRGENSLRLDGGLPLYVVDGVIIQSNSIESNSPLYSLGIDPLANLNLANVESIEVLKDADATSIYGSRGANGVIIITTKKARQSGTNLDLRLYKGFGRISQRLDLLNTQEYLLMRKEAFANNGAEPSEFDYDLTFWDSSKYTDWQDVLLGGQSKITDVQATFSGGKNGTNFRLGGSYHKETLFISDDFGITRPAVSFDFSHNSADKRLSIMFSTNYGINRNKTANLGSIVESALSLSPNAPNPFKTNGALNWEIIDLGFLQENTFLNPFAELVKTNEFKASTLIANSLIGYEIFPHLNFKTSLGYTTTIRNERIKEPFASFSPTSIAQGISAFAVFGNNNRSSWIIEPQLSYRRETRRHIFDFLVGASMQENESKWESFRGEGYSSDVLLNSLSGAASFFVQSDAYSKYRYMAAFGRFGYNFSNKYLLNITGRRDGSSRFGPGKQFANFGAIGAAWIFSEEEFMKGIDKFFNYGKLRMSYGTTGNDQITDYGFYKLYTIGLTRYQNIPTLLPSNLFNPNFRWEITKKFETSLELNFLQDRVAIQSSYYHNLSGNQLINYQLPFTTGFETILTNFNAEVENKGWEFAIQSQNFITKEFSWQTSLNFTMPRNKLISFPGIESTAYASLYKIGEPLSVQNQYTWKGIDQNTGEHVIADLNNDGVIDVLDKRFLVNYDQKYYGGMSNTLRYKSVEISFLFQFSKREGIGDLISSLPGVTQTNTAREVMDRWQKPGDITQVAKLTTDFNLYNFYYTYVRASTFNNVDASFLKLRTLSISYAFSSKLLQRTGLSDLRLYMQGQNLWTASDYAGLDPETGGRTLPQQRMITFGIQLKL